MGIDIYMTWKGMTEEEKQARYTGFSIVSGNLGYLREAYHGGPYVTQYFVREAFEDGIEDERGVQIAAKTLQGRKKTAIALYLMRALVVYQDPNPYLKAAFEHVQKFIDANRDRVDLDVMNKLGTMFITAFTENMETTGDPELDEVVSGALKIVSDGIDKMIEEKDLPEGAMSYVSFADLAETKEMETGEPVWIYASY